MKKMIVELPIDIQNKMRSQLDLANKREIGGILMGEQIDEDTFKIVEYSTDGSTGSHAHFVRSTEYHEIELQRFFARTGSNYSKFNYLGEWHSHPNHFLIPSRTDIASMNDLVHSERAINFAILLIIKKGWWRPIRCVGFLFCRGQSPQSIHIKLK